MTTGRVLSKAGGRYRVETSSGTVEASLRGRLRRGRHGTVLVGDSVHVHGQADGSFVIADVLERRTLLRRRMPGKSRGTRMVAANVDQVIVVGSASQPTWDDHMMDRFLAVAAANGLPVLLVVNKIDLGGASVVSDSYRRAGYEVLETSTVTSVGISALRRRLHAAASLLTGPTGVGKSSLLNAMVPGLALRTGRVGHRSGAGRHTTVSAEMIPLGNGSYVVDTPGLRDIGLWGVSAAELAAGFPEIRQAAGSCRFDDCRHGTEPDCAVKAAVEAGEVSATRLASYRALLEETQTAQRQW